MEEDIRIENNNFILHGLVMSENWMVKYSFCIRHL